MTRIFTTLKEVDDSLILYGYVAGFILNSVLVAQMVFSNSINDASLRRMLTRDIRCTIGIVQQQHSMLERWARSRKKSPWAPPQARHRNQRVRRHAVEAR